MRGWRRSATVASVLLALLPATAFAQSAGDDQYSDPFPTDDQQQSEPQATATPAPAAPAVPAQAQAPAQSAPTAPTAAAPAQSGQLPRTGWDAAVPGTLGLIFVSAGVALRARVRRDA